MKKLLFAIIIFSSCQRIPISGLHELTVKTAAHRGKTTIVTFKEMKGEMVFPTDTLKKGNKVRVQFGNSIN